VASCPFDVRFMYSSLENMDTFLERESIHKILDEVLVVVVQPQVVDLPIELQVHHVVSQNFLGLAHFLVLDQLYP